MKASGRGVEPFVVGRSSNLGKNSGSSLVARKNLPSYKNRYAKSHNGLPFGTAPTHKAVGRVFFAVCRLRTAACEISITPSHHIGYRRTGYRHTGCRHQGYPNSRRNRVRLVLVLCSVRGVRAG